MHHVPILDDDDETGELTFCMPELPAPFLLFWRVHNAMQNQQSIARRVEGVFVHRAGAGRLALLLCGMCA